MAHKRAFTTVFNLRTGAEYVYDLPPKTAVAIAYRQHELGDWNWWEERQGAAIPLVEEGAHSVVCADYCALKESK